ncbi:MAG: hypothetical protein GY818_02245 [Planctomycetaceae bacterium]|nr:hypothetical protein [Planctomycetaceae bacterium]
MITEKELKIANCLRGEKSEIGSLIRAFESEYVWASVGIVDINNSDRTNPKKSEHAKFFHNHMTDIKQELNKLAIDRLKHRLKEINLELSKYIKKPT